MSLKVLWTSQFKRDYKAAMKRGLDIDLLNDAIRMIAERKSLPERMRDHALTGSWRGHRECHIAPDWLLVYKIHEDKLVLTLARTGSHANLLDL